MRLLAAVFLAALLGACAAPRNASFDTDDWLQRARVAAAGPDLGDPGRDVARRRSAELDAAVGWSQACDTWWNPETGELESLDRSTDGRRGTYTLHDIPGGTVVSVTCDFGAYQGSYALVSLSDGRATLLAGDHVDLEGAPFGPPLPVYSTPEFDGSDRFKTFARARGLGDCGILSTYEIADADTATLVEARARDCEGDPEQAGLPETWPIVFPR